MRYAVTKTVFIQSDTLRFPVKNGAPSRLLQCSADGGPVREFEIELAQGKPDFRVFMDVRPYRGKYLEITVDGAEDDDILNGMEQGDDRIADDLYQEELRPQFHFSAKRGWINDPNGLVFCHKEYHLFFQHNPYGTKWGNMHWGHAVSEDLLHWTELGEALYPDELGTMFSGCGILDANDTMGLKCDPQDPVLFFYTCAGNTSRQSRGQKFTQCMAYSKDCGRTLTKYPGNPALPNIKNDNRDPKVIWHEKSRQWIMALYIDKDEFALLSSRDLKSWSKLQDYRIPGTGECPDIFELALDGDPKKKKWVLWSANGSYLVGDFDGFHFTGEDRVITGRTIQSGYSYAAQTWYNGPDADNRIIQIAWATITTPDMPFNGCMTFPCELTLRTTEKGMRIYTNPIREIEKLRDRTFSWEPGSIRQGNAIDFEWDHELYDLSCELDLGSAEKILIGLNGLELVYHASEQTLSCKGQSAVLKPENGKIRLRILMDRAIAEIYGNNGAVYMPVEAINRQWTKTIRFLSENGDARLDRLDISVIKPIWTEMPVSFACLPANGDT